MWLEVSGGWVHKNIILASSGPLASLQFLADKIFREKRPASTPVFGAAASTCRAKSDHNASINFLSELRRNQVRLARNWRNKKVRESGFRGIILLEDGHTYQVGSTWRTA